MSPLESVTCVPFWQTADAEADGDEVADTVELPLRDCVVDILAMTALDSDIGTSDGSVGCVAVVELDAELELDVPLEPYTIPATIPADPEVGDCGRFLRKQTPPALLYGDQAHAPQA